MNQNEINLGKHGFYQPKPANTLPWFDSNDNINKGLSKDELNSRSSRQGKSTALADITNKAENRIAAAASSQSSMGNIINDNDILNDVSCNRVSPRKKAKNQYSFGGNLKNVKIISEEEQKDDAFEEPVKELYERITSGCSKFGKIQMMRGQEERIKIPEEKEYPGKKESYWAYGDYKRMRKLGEGAHGSVVEIRNDYGDVKVIKIFKKELQKKFLREVSILSMLRHNWDRGYVGVWDVLQAKDVYGVVLSSGVGTLNDFKCFLKEEDKELTEDNLKNVFKALYNNYLTIRRAGLCHRDIKPANIILHKDGLAIEIIDFSLSVYTEPEGCFLGWVGTRGYIDPCIFNSTEEYGREKLIRGDFFAIGITLLELAVPNFEPKQNDMDRVRNAISGIREKKNVIAEIIGALIFHDENEFGVLDKYSVTNREIEVGNSGFISGLHGYGDNFLNFLAKKLPNQADSLETIQLNTLTNNNGQISSAQLKMFAENCFSANSRRKEQFNKAILASNMKLAALCFLQSNQEDKASLCYELIIDVYLTNQALTEGENLQEKLNEILQYEKFIRNPLIYSRLGIYFYKHSQIERAKICFLKGLERPQGKVTRALLLNNYGYICSIVDQDLNSSDLHHAFNIIKEIIYKDSDWSTITDNLLNHDYCKKFEVKFIDLKQPSDREEPILSIKDISWRYPFAENLALIVFLNFCYAKANFLADVFKRKNQESLLEKFQNFSQGFYERANSITKLKPQFELLVDLFRFQKIILDNTESLLSIEPEGVKLIEESMVIEEQKKDIYALFEQGAIKYVMECELFSIMLGFAVKFKPQNTAEDSLSKDIILDKLSVMKEVVKTVELFIEDPFCWEEMTNIINDPQEDLNFDMNLEINESELTPPDSLCQYIERYGYIVTLDGAKQCCSLSYLHLVTEEVLPYQWSNLMESSDFSRLKDIREVYWEIHSQGFLCLKKLLCDTSLLKLNLKINNSSYEDLNDYDIKVLAESISQCKKSLNSFEIEISISYITDGGVEFLWQAIENLEALKDLRLTFKLCPNITDNSLLTFEKAIRKLTQLSDFTLSFYSCCEISFQGIEKFQLLIQDLVQIKQSNISIVPLLSTE